MSNALKKLWPYLLALAVLFGIAVLTEEHLPFSIFSENEDTVDNAEQDSAVVEVDSLSLVPPIAEDTVIAEPVVEIEHHVESTEKQWCLVISSMPTKEKADEFAAKVPGGNASVRFVEYLDTYRVVYGSYTDLRDAQAAYEGVSAEYPNAWLVLF